MSGTIIRLAKLYLELEYGRKLTISEHKALIREAVQMIYEGGIWWET